MARNSNGEREIMTIKDNKKEGEEMRKADMKREM